MAAVAAAAAAAAATSSIGKVVQITNIAPQATRDQMHTLFGFLGKIEDIRLYPTIRDVAVPVQSRICYVKFTDPVCVGIAQHMTNTVFIDRALIVVPFQNEIPDEQRALELTQQGTMVPGLFPVEPKWPQNVTNQLDGTPPNQVVITHDPRLVQHNLPLYPPLPGTLDFRRVEEIRRTVLVLNVDDAVTTEEVIDYFNTAGEVKYARFCSKEDDSEKFVLVEFTDQNSIIAALQMNGKEFAGNIIKVFHSTQAIVKPQAKSNEAAQKEIEEAMSRVKEAQNLISAAIDPVIGLLAKEKKRSRSRSRSRRSRSPSRGRRRSRSRSRRTRSRSRRRSRNRRSRSRRRSRSISKRTRSRSRDRKRRSSRSPRRRRSRSRSHSRRSRSRSRSHSKSKSKSSKGHDKKEKKDEKREIKKEIEKDFEGKMDDGGTGKEQMDEGRGGEIERDSDKSKYKIKEKEKGKDKDKSRDKLKPSRGKSSSRSPSKSRHRKSRSPTAKKPGSPSRRKSPHMRPKSPSPPRHGGSHSRRRSKSPRNSHSRHSPGHRRSGSLSKPLREEKKKEMDRSHEKDKREKDEKRRDRREDKGGEKGFGTKVPRNYDEEEEGFDANEQDRRDGDRDEYTSSNQSYQDGDHSNSRDPRLSGHHSENNPDDMDISTSP